MRTKESFRLTKKRDSPDDEEAKVEVDITPQKKKRVRTAATPSITTPSSNVAPAAAAAGSTPAPGPTSPTRSSPSKAKPGRPRKSTTKGTPKNAQNDLSVEVEDAEKIPTIDQLEDRSIYKTYNKLKVGVEGSKPGVTAADMTFAIGDTCVLRPPEDARDSNADEWICRIERIRAKDANCVYCVVRWFYTLQQAMTDLRMPKSSFKGIVQDEILVTDHLDVIDVSAVDSHVRVTFGSLIDGADYCYKKKIAGIGSPNRKLSVISMTDPLPAPDSPPKVTLL